LYVVSDQCKRSVTQ